MSKQDALTIVIRCHAIAIFDRSLYDSAALRATGSPSPPLSFSLRLSVLRWSAAGVSAGRSPQSHLIGIACRSIAAIAVSPGPINDLARPESSEIAATLEDHARVKVKEDEEEKESVDALPSSPVTNGSRCLLLRSLTDRLGLSVAAEAILSTIWHGISVRDVSRFSSCSGWSGARWWCLAAM